MWYMNEERAMIRDMVRNFTQNEVKAAVKEMEENDAYPHELMRKAGDLGILGLAYPEEVGGQGQDFVNLGIAIEEIAKESPCAALCVLLSGFLGARPIYDLGTPEQKEKILKPIIEGKEIFVNSLTEPVGINNWFDYRTTAVLDGDEWVINGGKIFATNAGESEWYSVMCVTGEIDPMQMKGLSMILVRKDTPGFKVGHIENKLGLHGSSTGQLYFKDCRVPKENVLGTVDFGYAQLAPNTMKGMAFLGIIALGLAEGVYEKTVQYCKERMHVGKSLYDSYQVVRHQLADMYAKIDMIKAELYAILDDMNSNDPTVLTRSLVAKGNAAHIAEEIASKCVLLHGGNGVVVENDIERYFRDAKMWDIAGGDVPALIDAATMFL